MIGQDPYYSLPEVSNSDLSALKNYFMPRDYVIDATAAYRFGNLIDAMITEPHRCDWYSFKVDDEKFSREEWIKAEQMMAAFMKDPECLNLHKMSTGQNVKREVVTLEYEGVTFTLPMRCKFDLWMDPLQWGSDIKSTAATTQKGFEDAIRHFDYDRQRAVYMTLANSQRDMLIGISKVNFKIFKVRINRESELFKSGMAKFTEWAFRYWTLFGDINTAA